MLQIKKMRLPTCAEYDALAIAAKENNDIMHWDSIFSWCQNVDPDWASYRAVRGYRSARLWNYYDATRRFADVGFRPAFEIQGSGPLLPDGTSVVIGTLYMGDESVKIPQNPTWDGDIPDYIPGTKLELREAMDDPAYQVLTIKAGNVLISDRVLLRSISWNECNGEARHEETTPDTHKTLEGDTKMEKTQAIIYIGDTKHGPHTIVCSKKNEKNVLAFLSKRYPEWVKEHKGTDLALRCKLLDAIEDMKCLLEDESIELLNKSGVAAIRLEDEVYGACAVACSQKNEEKVKAFLTRRYPKWAGKCIGKTGMTPWNDVLDTVRDMRELLDDDKLEFLGGYSDILIPDIPSQS